MPYTEDQIDRAAEALADQLKAGAPIDYVKHDGGNDYTFDGTLNVLDLAQTALLAAQQPVILPDRDELAFTLFAADNRLMPPEQIKADFDQLKREQAAAGEPFYADVLADVAIAEFRRLNS